MQIEKKVPTNFRKTNRYNQKKKETPKRIFEKSMQEECYKIKKSN